MPKDEEIIFIVEESPEGGYEAHSLGHSIFTEAGVLKNCGPWFMMRFPVILTRTSGPASSGFIL